MNIWPWSDLVSMVMRYARPSGPSYRIVELGCGAGANVPFFLSLQAEYYAVEGSPYMVARLKERYPEIADRFVAGDFTAGIPFAGAFDLVVDRSAVTHDSTKAIQQCLRHAFDKLRPGGAFLGIDWFSTENSEMGYGEIADDEHTRTNFQKGQFAHVGKVHFSDEEHLRFLLADFNVEVMEHKIIDRCAPADDSRFATWNFLARKR